MTSLISEHRNGDRMTQNKEEKQQISYQTTIPSESVRQTTLRQIDESPRFTDNLFRMSFPCILQMHYADLV